jgi:hypothetical protein
MKDQKKERGPEAEYEVAYCGRYCRPCHSQKDAMNRAATQLLEIVKNHIGVARSIDRQGGDHKATIKGLEILSKYACKFNCKGGGGWQRCAIRNCCSTKGFSFCYECKDFPCKEQWKKWHSFSETEIQHLQEIKEKGIEKWINEQWG